MICINYTYFRKIFLKELGKIAVVPLAGTWIEIFLPFYYLLQRPVVPLAGTWIEIFLIFPINQNLSVVPLAGTWIEIIVL